MGQAAAVYLERVCKCRELRVEEVGRELCERWKETSSGVVG